MARLPDEWERYVTKGRKRISSPQALAEAIGLEPIIPRSLRAVLHLAARPPIVADNTCKEMGSNH